MLRKTLYSTTGNWFQRGRSSNKNNKRCIHSRRKMKNPVHLPRALVTNFPVKTTKPSSQDGNNNTSFTPEAPLYSFPVTSAHAIDLGSFKVSALDSAALDPNKGTILHGRYGELDPDATLGVPLEYLALLRHAAEGAAGLRALSSSKNNDNAGTVLIYGASQANGLAALQMASSKNNKNNHVAVVGIVDGQHSGNEDMVEYIKAMIPEPGIAVAQEYAMVKKNFADLVSSIATGNEQLSSFPAIDSLEDFKANLKEYARVYPDTMPAAVNSSNIKFLGMEKDKDQFRANMDTYLSQFQPGCPPLSHDQLDTQFSTDHYKVFRQKFWDQTTSIISGDESHFFSPPHIVHDLMKEGLPPKPPTTTTNTAEAFESNIPFAFSPFQDGFFFPTGTEIVPGGPIVGAIISVTPDLKVASETVSKATLSSNSNKISILRAKAEALQFLTEAQKDAFAAATSVAAQATNAGAPVVTIGGESWR